MERRRVLFLKQFILIMRILIHSLETLSSFNLFMVKYDFFWPSIDLIVPIAIFSNACKITGHWTVPTEGLAHTTSFTILLPIFNKGVSLTRYPIMVYYVVII